LQDCRMIWTCRTNTDDVFFGERWVVEQNANDVGVGVAHDALNQRAVVCARERLPFAEREWTTVSEVGHTTFVFRKCLVLWSWRDEVRNLVKLCSSCRGTKLGSPGPKAWLEECPTKREKHRLCVGPATRCTAMGLVEQPYSVFIRQGFEPFADQAHTHVDLVQPC